MKTRRLRCISDGLAGIYKPSATRRLSGYFGSRYDAEALDAWGASTSPLPEVSRTSAPALTVFSKPARGLCQVTWAGDEHYDYAWAADADIWFRCMDLTEAAIFTLGMAEASLDTHMRREVAFLGLFDQVKRFIDARYDLRGSDLATLIVTVFQNGGTLSKNRRKRYAERVQPAVLDAIEDAVRRAMQGQPLDDAEQD